MFSGDQRLSQSWRPFWRPGPTPARPLQACSRLRRMVASARGLRQCRRGSPPRPHARGCACLARHTVQGYLRRCRRSAGASNVTPRPRRSKVARGGGRAHDQRNRQAGLRGRCADRGGVAPAGRGGAMAGVGVPYHLGDGVAAGRARSTSSGALQIRRLGRNTFRMSVWEPPVRWEWVGGLPGVRIYYDHRFESSGPAATQLTGK